MLPVYIPTRVPTGPPRSLLWTVDQFHYLGDLGMFEGRRAMLIDGVIVEQGPMNPPHRLALELTADAIRAAFGSGWRACVQMPLVLGQTTDPEPDIAVVAGSVRGATAHPTTAALVVEVSDTSVRYDTTTKVGAYAAGGIRDYWVLDVNARQLLVFRDPQPDPSVQPASAASAVSAVPGTHTFATRLTLNPTDTVSPLAAPTATITVAELLP
jgi:Uma2 family endonuclease